MVITNNSVDSTFLQAERNFLDEASATLNSLQVSDKKGEQSLSVARKAADILSSELDAQKQQLHERESVLSGKEAVVGKMEEKLDAREAELNAKVKQCNEKEERLRSREVELSQLESELEASARCSAADFAQEAATVANKTNVSDLLFTVAAREHLERMQRSLMDGRTQLAADREAVTALRCDVEKKATALASKEAQHEERLQNVASREQSVSEHEKELSEKAKIACLREEVALAAMKISTAPVTVAPATVDRTPSNVNVAAVATAIQNALEEDQTALNLAALKKNLNEVFRSQNALVKIDGTSTANIVLGRGKNAKVERELADARKENNVLKTNLATAVAEKESSLKQLVNGIRDLISSPASQGKREYPNEIRVHMTRLEDTIVRNRKKTDDKVEQLSKSLQDADARYQSVSDSVRQVREEAAQKHSSGLRTKDSEIADLKGKLAKMKMELDASKRVYAQMVSSKEAFENRHASLVELEERLAAQKHDLETQVSTFSAREKEVEEKDTAMVQREAEVMKGMDEVKSSLSKVEKKGKNLKKRESKITQKQAELEKQHEAVRAHEEEVKEREQNLKKQLSTILETRKSVHSIREEATRGADLAKQRLARADQTMWASIVCWMVLLVALALKWN